MTGRPTEYKGEETIDKAKKYIASCKDTKKEVKLPTAEGLALYLDVNKSTLYRWAEDYPAFCDILDNLNKEQANRLINRGLSGKYNSNIAKLVLAKHGYKDQLGLSGEDAGSPIKVEILDAIKKTYGDTEVH